MLYQACLQTASLNAQMPAQTPGYYVSAIIGVVLCAGIMYVAGKAIARKN